MSNTPELAPGDWVVSRSWERLAQVKDFHPGFGSLEPSVDLVLFARDGTRIGRESPAMGGPKGFEPCCGASNWVRIKKPAFPLPRYDPLFRAVKFIDPADMPEDDGRL